MVVNYDKEKGRIWLQNGILGIFDYEGRCFVKYHGTGKIEMAGAVTPLSALRIVLDHLRDLASAQNLRRDEPLKLS